MRFTNDKSWFTAIVCRWLSFTYNKSADMAAWRVGPFAWFYAGCTGRVVRLPGVPANPVR